MAPAEPPGLSGIRLVAGAATAPDGLVGVGGDLSPATLITAYRSGLFPMPAGRGRLGWWSPDPRGVLPLGGLRVSASLRRAVRHLEVTVDCAFEEVVTACGHPGRPGGWITGEIRRAYTALHELGFAHSVETWTEAGELAGGLYGVAVGGLFAGESMFHRRRDASKAALVALVGILAEDDGGAEPADRAGRLLDVQWLTPHLASLGAVEVTRREYLRRLETALGLPPPSRLRRR